MTSFIPSTAGGYTPFNIVIIAFAYPVHPSICPVGTCIGVDQTFDFDPRITALGGDGLYSFATNTFGFNVGGNNNPYVGKGNMFIDSLRAWKAVEPTKRKVTVSIGGASSVTPMFEMWKGDEAKVAQGLVLFAEMWSKATGIALDGIDLDVEILDPYTMCKTMDTLAALTVELRKQFDAAGKTGFMITHAPQTPYLDPNHEPQDDTCVAPRTPWAEAYCGCYFRMLALIQKQLPRAIAPGVFQLNIQAYNNPAYQGFEFDMKVLEATSAGGVMVPGLGPAPSLCPGQLLLGMYTNGAQKNPINSDAMLSVPDMQYLNSLGYGTMLWSDAGDEVAGLAVMRGYFPPPSAVASLAAAVSALASRAVRALRSPSPSPSDMPGYVIAAIVLAALLVVAVIVIGILGARVSALPPPPSDAPVQ